MLFARPAIGGASYRRNHCSGGLGRLRVVEARGRHETASWLGATIGAVFRFAVATGRAEDRPDRRAERRVDRAVRQSSRLRGPSRSALAGPLRAMAR